MIHILRLGSCKGGQCFAPCNYPVGECNYESGLCICPDGVLVTWITGLGNTGTVTGVFDDDDVSKLAKQTLGMDEGTLLNATKI